MTPIEKAAHELAEWLAEVQGITSIEDATKAIVQAYLDASEHLYRQAWELNNDTPNAVFTVDAVGAYYEGYLVRVVSP